MKTLIITIVAVLALSGCFFSESVAGNYREVVGSEFVTTREMKLWKMQDHQYVFEPYHVSNWPLASFGTLVQTVPAGSRLRVVDARFKSNIDAGFDYLIADLYLSSDASPIRFEQMIANEADSEYFRRIWKKVR
jgi:hypothetical protein